MKTAWRGSGKGDGEGPNEEQNEAYDRDRKQDVRCAGIVQNARPIKVRGALGRMGRILGRLGTDVGTDKMCKIVNVYRPWDGGTDKLGGGKGVSTKLQVPGTRE